MGGWSREIGSRYKTNMSIFNYKEQPGYFTRLKEALQGTQQEISQQIDQLMGSAESSLTEAQLEELEQILIGADIGVHVTLRIVEEVREKTRGHRLFTSQRLKRMIREIILEILRSTESPDGSGVEEKPRVIFVVGVNGVGKTTTIGKLAHRFSREGKQVLICASDTFRAAAVEQLRVWAERARAEMVRQSAGADPAAVLYDALAASRSRQKDVLIVDTAGRLHTRTNLMQELEKMKRVAGREIPGAPHCVYLVLDATTGQNGLAQARQFLSSVGVTAIIVTKLDGTAKGGIVVAIARELKLPIGYVGVGEGVEDLMPFSAEAFVDSLLL